MKKITNKPIAFFELETTGVNIATDRIVEISIIKIFPDGTRQTYTKRVNPTIPISPGATEVHGITNEDVADAPTFAEIAPEVYTIFEGSDMAGFNIIRFDLPLLVEEMLRAGAPSFPSVDTKFVDAMSIFHHFERRDLTAALKYYCNKDLENAHSAEADTIATAEILSAQVEKYGLSSIDELQEISNRGKEIIDYAGKFTRNENGDIVFAFGKHQGEKLTDKLSYVDWMLRSEFTRDTKQKAKLIINGDLV